MPEQTVPVGRIRTAGVMLRIAWTADRPRAALAFGLGTAEALAQSLLAWWLKLILDGIAAGDTRQVVAAAAAAAVSISGGAGLSYARSRTVAMLSERTRHLIDRRLLELVGGTPTLEIHETPEHQTQLEILQGRETWVFGELIPSLVSFTTLTVRIISTGLLLASVHPLLLLLPIFGLPTLMLSSKIGAAVAAGDEQTAEPMRHLDHLYGLATTAAAAKEVRLFGLGEQLLSRFRDTQSDQRKLRLRIHLRATLIGAAARAIFLIGYLAAILFTVQRAIAGDATPGDAVLTAVLAGQVLGLITSSAEMIGWVWRGLAAAGRFVYLETIAKRSLRRIGQTPPPDRLVNGIRLEHVGYRYPRAAHDALHDLTLHLPAGATIAIVGDNGAGKTTLVKLLAGLYQPTHGRITIDGIDLETIDPQQWRIRTSAGFQDHARFEFPAGQTVGIGNLESIHDDHTVRAALDRAGSIDVLQSLPHGLNTQLGPSWTDGVDLSGGQWQKLALGRAMMRRTPLLLLLDEPTAALDADTEHHLFQRWTTTARDLRERAGAVSVLVSHRFSTVRMADLIVVLNQSRIVEIGNHDQLIANRGLYAELFNLQARSYQ